MSASPTHLLGSPTRSPPRRPVSLSLAGFQFSHHSSFFDWRLLHGIDVDTVVGKLQGESGGGGGGLGWTCMCPNPGRADCSCAPSVQAGRGGGGGGA